jgi:hypothetical protein
MELLEEASKKMPQDSYLNLLDFVGFMARYKAEKIRGNVYDIYVTSATDAIENKEIDGLSI